MRSRLQPRRAPTGAARFEELVKADFFTDIKFFRVVLDEAQMVESGVANAARLARKIASSHAWAVSGTPLGKDKLDDLHGLLFFLFPVYALVYIRRLFVDGGKHTA